MRGRTVPAITPLLLTGDAFGEKVPWGRFANRRHHIDRAKEHSPSPIQREENTAV